MIKAGAERAPYPGRRALARRIDRQQAPEGVITNVEQPVNTRRLKTVNHCRHYGELTASERTLTGDGSANSHTNTNGRRNNRTPIKIKLAINASPVQIAATHQMF